MVKIRTLDESTIQKIAAGEIIERPSSIIKELVENSLDADSTNITVEIANAGKDYIRVTDNGSGFTGDNLRIAFKRYSTSKLNNIDDLFQIASFGFRGEALASISAVSKVEVLTKTHNTLSGLHAFIENGKIVKLEPVGCPKGTTMKITDLFYNLPVRKKFLKSDLVENNYINDILYRLALGNSGIAFKFIRDNRIIFNTSINNDLKSNIYTLLGKDFYRNLIEFNIKSSDFHIYGYISNNNFYRSNRNHQYIFVNNRYIKNESIAKCIENNYKSIIPINRFPIFIVFIDIDPLLIDVNIHPTKQEIKFANQENIIEILSNEINDTLNRILSITKIPMGKTRQDKTEDEMPLLYEKAFVEEGEAVNYLKETPGNAPMMEKDQDKLKKDLVINDKYDLEYMLETVRIVGLLFSTFIILENRELDKVLLVDQHAAHERILYEKYKHEYVSEKVTIQYLISPELIELSIAEAASVAKNISLLNRLGFIVEEFGNNSVILRGVPMLFGQPEMKRLFLNIIDSIGQNIESSYESKLDKIAKIACTKAIKGGQDLTGVEIENLLEQLIKTENPYTCPHGRPTIIEVSKRSLEKEFKRTN